MSSSVCQLKMKLHSPEHAMNTALITVDSRRQLPLQTLQSGQLLQVSPQCRGGLILRNAHFAEFVGPGAAVGCSFDIRVNQVFPIGEVQLVYPELVTLKQQAYQRRRDYMRKQQELIAEPSALKRAHNIYSFLHKLYGANVVANISNELLANLAAVLPGTIQSLRTLYAERSQSSTQGAANPATVG